MIDRHPHSPFLFGPTSCPLRPVHMIKAKRGVGAVYLLTFAFYRRKHRSMNRADGCKMVQSMLSEKWVQSHQTLTLVWPATLEINREKVR